MEISERINRLEESINAQKREINELKEILKVKPALPPADELKTLKTLLHSDQWPAAVESYLICDINSTQDKKDRAEGILDIIIDTSLNKLKFLDFGCGEGHVVKLAVSHDPTLAVGYDIVGQEEWATNEKSIFTTDWEEVKKNAPYDIILIYDVLDHIEGDENTIIEELKKIKNVMAPNAKLFVRCHPWCARHGTHLYKEINKAYIQVVFTTEEIKDMGYKETYARKIIHPLNTYSDWFQKAGLRYHRKEQVVKLDVEKFFKETEIIARRIKTNWINSPERELKEGRKFPYQLEFQFCDFVLVA